MRKLYLGGFAVLAVLVLVGGACSRQKDTVEPIEFTPLEQTLPDEVSNDDAHTVDDDTNIVIPSTPSAKEINDINQANDSQQVKNTTEGAVPDDSTSKVINVSMKRFEYEPSIITVNLGDTVTLNLTSEDVAHGFAITEYGINIIVSVGETISTSFVADKSGTFTFRCSVYCGSGHGSMSGTLVVN